LEPLLGGTGQAVEPAVARQSIDDNNLILVDMLPVATPGSALGE